MASRKRSTLLLMYSSLLMRKYLRCGIMQLGNQAKISMQSWRVCQLSHSFGRRIIPTHSGASIPPPRPRPRNSVAWLTSMSIRSRVHIHGEQQYGRPCSSFQSRPVIYLSRNRWFASYRNQAHDGLLNYECRCVRLALSFLIPGDSWSSFWQRLCPTRQPDWDIFPNSWWFDEPPEHGSGLLSHISPTKSHHKMNQYTSNKGFAEDLTEGKFSFPVIHAIHANTGNRQVLSAYGNIFSLFLDLQGPLLLQTSSKNAHLPQRSKSTRLTTSRTIPNHSITHSLSSIT